MHQFTSKINIENNKPLRKVMKKDIDIKEKKDSFFKPVIQASTKNNSANDKFEIQANSVAEKIIDNKLTKINNSEIIATDHTVKSIAENKILDKNTNEINNVLNAPGQKLDTNIIKLVEPKFGINFNDVKIHTDTRANKSAEKINAAAYTSGNNIVFAQGKYNPKTNEGKKLIVHELTHVVQQRKGIIKQNTIQKFGIPRIMDPFGIIDYLGDELVDFGLNQVSKIYSRKLTGAERSILVGIFKGYLDYDSIRISENSLLAFGDTPRTTGNIINIPGNSISTDTLIHEAAHVFQHQNFGKFNYISNALAAQAYAAMFGSSRNDAYDWQARINSGQSFCSMNAEAQAQYISDNRKLPPDQEILICKALNLIAN